MTSLKLAAIFLGGLLSISYITANAEQKTNRWYSVEYIIFENAISTGHYLEPWNKDPLHLPSDAIVLNTRSTQTNFSHLTPKQQQLHGAANRLKKLADYQVMTHNGWIQILNPQTKRLPVLVVQQVERQQIEGVITLHRGKHLHLDLDIQLTEQGLLTNRGLTETSHPTTLSPAIYRLKQTRRIKSGEINYFDHPRFGVICLVTEIDPPYSPSQPTVLTVEEPAQLP
ncbi:MAG: peptidoglycan binding protein CsiV [Cycloclasticus sp.]|nr:peptidoglycan binding protein CsiV [Cycloclasticus sp.]